MRQAEVEVSREVLDAVSDMISDGVEHFSVHDDKLAYDKLAAACEVAGRGAAGQRVVVWVLLRFLSEGTPPVHQHVAGAANVRKLLEMFAARPASAAVPSESVVLATQAVVDAGVVAPAHVLRHKVGDLGDVLEPVMECLYRIVAVVMMWIMTTGEGNPM